MQPPLLRRQSPEGDGAHMRCLRITCTRRRSTGRAAAGGDYGADPGYDGVGLGLFTEGRKLG